MSEKDGYIIQRSNNIFNEQLGRDSKNTRAEHINDSSAFHGDHLEMKYTTS